MSTRMRQIVFMIFAAGFAVFVVWGLLGLPPYGEYKGPYGTVLQQTTVPERHVTDVVTSVMFDQRGLDSLGEEFILFAAVVGVSLLLREHRTGGEDEETEDTDELPSRKTGLLNMTGRIFAPVIFVFGAYIIAQAHITVGGGFQGGIVVAAAFLMVYLADERRLFRAVAPKRIVEVFEAFGAGAYSAIGIGGILAGAMFLQNVLPLGKAKAILSGGTIPVINLAVGIEVTAAFVLLVVEFFKEAEKAERGEE